VSLDLLVAERAYLLAQALPGYTEAEVDATPAVELDRILAISQIYRKVGQ